MYVLLVPQHLRVWQDAAQQTVFAYNCCLQDCHIRARIVPYYPHLLAKQLECDNCPL
jgi:hypothetical protein